MTFEEFILKYTYEAVYNFKGIDTDQAWGYQCMDLMHKFIDEVLGLPDYRILAAPTAAQVYFNFPYIFGSDKFTKIDNTPTGVPLKGDIMFFKQYGTLYGPAGHVCVVYKADIKAMCTFDQNYPTGSLPHLQKHNYLGCLGWLRVR